MRISDWSSDVCSSDLLSRCSAFGYYDHNQIQAVQLQPGGAVRQRLLHIRAAEVILATGAIERPLVFPNNDRPGIMLAHAGLRYLRQYGVSPGRSEEHTSELQSLMRISYAVFCLTK